MGRSEFKKVPFRHIKNAAAKIASRVRPEKIILFGSYAYGRPNFDSDVDFLIVVRGKTRRHRNEAYLKATHALYPRPFPVDLI